MFDGQMNTYLHVREFVEATYGPLDDDSERQFLVMAGNALDVMWADVRKSNYYLSSWTVDKDTEADDPYALPEEVALLCSATGSLTTGEGEDAVTTTTKLELHLSSCPLACSDTIATQPGWKTLDVGWSALVPEAGYEPDTIQLTGYRRPSHQFFTAATVDDQTCLTWADIDLPKVFRNVYAKGVVGLMFFAGGDGPRGADWLSLANGEFATLKRANPTIVDGTAAQRGIYKMGSRSLLTRSRCCDPAEGWRLVTP